MPQDFESKWVDLWEKEGVYKTPARTSVRGKKNYVLGMFPYPSGEGLHTGHTRIYTASDILARFYRMNGNAVLFPMGWDAFGLPAENAAIKAKKNPKELVAKNISNFKRQMKMLGFSYDWEKELSTTDPNYYKWTQWIFIQFFKMGLLFKKDTPVYYCEFDKTGLSEEEVLPDGTHERCGNPITRKILPQWVFRITMYADRLLDDLDKLDWPEGIIQMQKNWIGKSEGTIIKFKLQDTSYKIQTIEVFTTRPDTIYGVTALVLAPEHPLVNQILQSEDLSDKNKKQIEEYIKEAQSKSDLLRTDLTKEKTGVNTSTFAINPASGEKIPIWVADYILGFYGSGAVMLVPAHDERDFEFARKYEIEIKAVIQQAGQDLPFTGEGIAINSGKYNGLTTQEFRKKIVEDLAKNNQGKKAVQYKLRDWIFSRQRYWGEPIPMIFCKNCADNKITYWNSEKLKIKNSKFKINSTVKESSYGWFPVDERELPILLPELKTYEPGREAKSPLDRALNWKKTICPSCGGEAERETDTMPNWAGSCWYFLRFADNKNQKEAWSKKSLADWQPVDWYIGGAEHAVLHLLYSRFWVKALFDLGLIDFPEPFLKLRNVGIVLATDSRKMSKSFGNIVNPDSVVKEFGADALRVYEMFMAPFSQQIAWSVQNLQGSYRFLKRIWQIYNRSAKMTKNQKPSNKILLAKLQSTIKSVSEDITNVKFNTAVSAMMEFLNQWQEEEREGRGLKLEDRKQFLKILAPFAPLIAEEIWREIFREKSSIHLSQWPKISKEQILDQELKIPDQVDGKVRSVLVVPKNKIGEKELVAQAFKSESISRHLKGKKYRVFYKQGEILNFVTQS